jgi:predicted nucleic acid-binding protein
MFYLDTSFAVSLVTVEQHSERAITLVAQLLQLGLRGIYSDWTQAEFSCALTAKFRAGHLLKDSMRAKVAGLQSLGGLELTCAAVLPSDIVRAGNIALNMPNQAIRAADALHLVIAQRLGATHFLTFDHHQASAARALMLGVEVIDG